VWVEVLIALVVEGYREFVEWWQTRAFLRPLPADAGELDSTEGPKAMRRNVVGLLQDR
jgi:hypothetical protein